MEELIDRGGGMGGDGEHANAVQSPAPGKLFNDISELVGGTPLLELKKIPKAEDLHARILVKLESYQPGFSVKDRIALSMMDDAEEKGLITRGISTVIEISSGNTGIAIAYLCLQRGYKFINIIPHVYSIERRMLLRALGAEVVVTDASKGFDACKDKLNELLDSIPNSHTLEQFSNPANPDAHFKTTGPEIWRDTDGKVDIFVACSGTGGTITGTGRYLKSKNSNAKIVVVEPAESSVIAGGKPGPHPIQGIGPGFIPDNLDVSVFDEVVAITGDDAIATAQRMAREEGLLVGISSGAAFAAALQVAKRPENVGKVIVALLPSAAERYMSTQLFANIREEFQNLAIC